MKPRLVLSPREIWISAIALVLSSRSAVAQPPWQLPESAATDSIALAQPEPPASADLHGMPTLMDRQWGDAANQSPDVSLEAYWVSRSPQPFLQAESQSQTNQIEADQTKANQAKANQTDANQTEADQLNTHQSSAHQPLVARMNPDLTTAHQFSSVATEIPSLPVNSTLYTRADFTSSRRSSDLASFSQVQSVSTSLNPDRAAVGANPFEWAELGDQAPGRDPSFQITLSPLTAPLFAGSGLVNAAAKEPGSPLLTLALAKQAGDANDPDKPDNPAASPDDDRPRLQVNQVIVTGNTAVDDAEIQQIVQPLAGQEVKFSQLQEASDRITQIYLDRGFITSRAVLLEQSPEDAQAGIVRIRVLEGQLERIEISGTRRIRPDYIRSRLALAATVPLRQDRLEDQLRLLRADPLFKSVEASLRRGDKVGQSILAVQVEEANPFVTFLNVDNYSPPRVGSERYGISLLHRNFTGRGDQLSGSFSTTSTTGSNLFDFGYRIPLNAMNGTLSVRVAPSYYRITDRDFVAFNVRGNTDLYEITYRQPLIRTPREEFALSLGFSYQTGQTFLFDRPTAFGVGPDPNTGVSTTSVIRFSQDYLRRDLQGAWALRSQFNLGLDIFNATTNPDPIPDGQFLSWLGQVQRVQLISANHILIIQADLQLAFNTLLPSQQFVIGGGQSVRGFRQNARSADNGFRFSIEDRITVQRDESGDPILQVVPFFDMGAVWNNSGNPNVLPTNQNFLAGVGLGVIWQPLPRFTVRLEYAYPFINLVDRTNNVQDAAFYFSVNYQP